MRADFEVTAKPPISTRAPLASRLPRKAKEPVPSSSALHRSLETTYDIAYAAVPSGSSTTTQFNTFMSSQGQNEDNTAAVVQRACDETSDTVAPKADQCATHTLTTHSPALWESEAHAATRCVQPEQPLDFYSNVRKMERVDDDSRSGLVGRVQRGVEILNKRSTHAAMQPPAPVFTSIQPPDMPLIAAQEKRLIKRNYLDLVECTQLDPSTEWQVAFTDAPLTRLPGSDLSQDLKVQSKIVSEMGTSRDLFRGYPKYVSNRPVGYCGHIPTDDRNLAAMLPGDDPRRVFAKSHMTLAVHCGGVDASINSNSIRARHRAGKNAPAAKTLKPRTDATVCQTVEGSMLQRTLHQTLDRERAMNIRDDNRESSYF